MSDSTVENFGKYYNTSEPKPGFFLTDLELRQLEVETFEIEDVVDVEQLGPGISFGCSATTSCTSTASLS